MIKIILIMIGGGIGAAFRHGLFIGVHSLTGLTFPVGTLSVNLLGSFLIGLFWGLFESSHLSPEMRLFLFTGVLGGFTTFSTFMRETTQLLKIGQWREAVLYLGMSNILGILLVVLGFFSAHHIVIAMRS
nr:fluoride efflux transporter CrcB [Desulfobulbaceae bacterium]